MSNKLIYIRIAIVAVCLLFASLFILLFNNMKESINVDKSILEETFVNEDKIVFDLKISPKKQRNKIIKNPKEYLKQVYEHIFPDEKIRKCMPLDILDGYEIVDHFSGTENLFNVLKSFATRQYIIAIIENDHLSLDSLPVTDNYIEKHPVSFKNEFSQYFKKDYSNPGNGTLYDMNYKYYYSYRYNIGCDSENQFVTINVDKSISYVCEDGTSGSLWGKKGSKYEGKELYTELKTIYFKYKLDEKGYLDDIWFDHIEVLADEREFDDSVR